MKITYYFFNMLLIGFVALACSGDDSPVDDKEEDKKEEQEEYKDPLESSILNTQQLTTGIVHQKGYPLETLYVVSAGSLSSEHKVLLSTLQGVLAKKSSTQIYIDEGGPSTVWVEYLRTAYGIKLNREAKLDDLLRKYVDEKVIEGYILYDRSKNERSLTVATSLCGPLNGVAIDKSILNDVLATLTIRKLTDVSNRDEKWLFENQPEAFSKVNVAELTPEINHHLRDYIALTNAFTFYDGITSWRTGVLQTLEPGAYCFGYGESEFDMVADASAQGVSMLPTDLAPNMAPLSSIYNTDGLKQRDGVKNVTTEEGVHYATFLVSDGDNIAYNMWSQQLYFNNKVRGDFAVGYTITPSLYDLAPAVLRWYFENSTENDYFVCGPSGSSYIFPSRMPEDALDEYVVKLNEFAGLTGLRICNVLDQRSVSNIGLWDKYLSQPNIDAIIYTGYGESARGSIRFSSNGKPIIEQSDNLWQGLQEEQSVINNLNSRPADPYSVDGYSLVFVHTWTKDLSDIQYVVDRLESHVRVVTPDVFVGLVQNNLNK